MSEVQDRSLSVNADNPSSDSHANDATSSDQAMAGSASPLSDPALSLRAAALLTLKSKRRKPNTDQLPSSSQRPIPSALVLNYGEEESTPTSTVAPLSAIGKTATSSAKTAASGVEDNREEGEISDTESTPPAIPKPRPSTKKASKAKVTSTDKTLTLKTSPTSAKPPVTVRSPSCAPDQKMESTPTTPVAGPSTSLAQSFLTAQSQIPPYIVDANHIRPGLAMTEKQYEAAKDIVLDLLGWGVEPEYIADTGVSREIIFYVFTELRLRLPRNLDTIGLIPYQLYSPVSEPPQGTPAVAQARQRSSSSAMAMPPPPSIPPRHDAPPFTPGRGAHPSLPQKPPAPQGNPTVSDVSRSNSGPPTQLSVLTNVREIEQQRKQTGAETNLHEIEQLRKQQLIARKAVQASHKKAAAANAPGPSPPATSPPLAESKDNDIYMAGVVPESVDDFLKSIGSVSDTDNGEGISTAKEAFPAHFRRHESPAPMEVDDIPGLLSGHGDASLSRPVSTQADGDAPTLRPGASWEAPTEPPSSADSISGFSEATSTEAGSSHQLKEDIPPGGQDFQQSEPGRRGIKRPVASDFVDFESAPQRPSNGYSNGGASQPPSLRRKTTGSFASVSGMRRCVIDLSDSEDDGDGEVHHIANERGQRIYSPLPTRVHPSTSMPPVATSGDRTPLQPNASHGNSGTQSPAALFAKEEEIKKMRELIAMREQSRLKKLAAMSRPASTSANNPPALPQATPPLSEFTSVVKREEDDSLTPSSTNGVLHPLNGRSHSTSENVRTQEVMFGVADLQNSSFIIPTSELSAPASGSPSASATPLIGSLSPSLAPSTAG